MRKTFLNICLLLPFVVITQYKPVLSGVYDWKQPVANASKSIGSSVLFEGSAAEMEWLQMTANVLRPMSKSIAQTVPAIRNISTSLKKEH